MPSATVIGLWAATSRPEESIRRSLINLVTGNGNLRPDNGGQNYRQVQRLGNPLINELIIGTGSKDYWSMSQPINDSQFASFDLNPGFVGAVDSLYSVLVPGALFSPPSPRTDLLPLVEYLPPIAASGTPAGPIADLLRLNTGVAPTGSWLGEPPWASRCGMGRAGRMAAASVMTL